jgi:hypothetical protein
VFIDGLYAANIQYRKRLFGQTWKRTRIPCSLMAWAFKVHGFHNDRSIGIHNTSVGFEYCRAMYDPNASFRKDWGFSLRCSITFHIDASDVLKLGSDFGPDTVFLMRTLTLSLIQCSLWFHCFTQLAFLIRSNECVKIAQSLETCIYMHRDSSLVQVSVGQDLESFHVTVM